jgi:hypothetical protein
MDFSILNNQLYFDNVTELCEYYRIANNPEPMRTNMYEALTEIRMNELTQHISLINHQLAESGVHSFSNPMYSDGFGNEQDDGLYDEPVHDDAISEDIINEPIYGYDNQNIKNERLRGQTVVINDTYDAVPLPEKMSSFRGRGSQSDV